MTEPWLDQVLMESAYRSELSTSLYLDLHPVYFDLLVKIRQKKRGAKRVLKKSEIFSIN